MELYHYGATGKLGMPPLVDFDDESQPPTSTNTEFEESLRKHCLACSGGLTTIERLVHSILKPYEDEVYRPYRSSGRPELPPDPAALMYMLGATLLVISAADNLTGIGFADDVLFIPVALKLMR